MVRIVVQNDSYAEVMDAFSSDELWANRSSRSAVYAEMLPSSSYTPAVLIPSVVVMGGGDSSRLACGQMKENPAVSSHSSDECYCGTMVTPGKEKPPKAGSWRVVSLASLRKFSLTSMMASPSWPPLSSKRACLSHISLWAFKSAQIILFSCISGWKTDIEKPIRCKKWEFSRGRY